MYKEIPVVIVAAMSQEQRVIGKDNALLWDLPEDRAHFRDETRGKPVVLGRKTFESILSILGKPLPQRPNIVVTRNRDYHTEYDNVTMVESLEAGLEAAAATLPPEIHIGGGSQLYEVAFPYVDELRLTLINDEPNGDAFFPDYTADFIETERSEPKTENGISYTWVTFTRAH